MGNVPFDEMILCELQQRTLCRLYIVMLCDTIMLLT